MGQDLAAAIALEFAAAGFEGGRHGKRLDKIAAADGGRR
jgi:ribose 5-phosphate isomerase RpiB